MKTILIFPHQLYKQHPAVDVADNYVCVEDSLFFGDYEYPMKFHKQKLVLHRASMKSYKAFLESQKKSVKYFEYAEYKTLESVFEKMKDSGVGELHISDVTDDVLRKRIIHFAQKFQMNIVWYESPNFLTTRKTYESFFQNKKNHFFTDFYIFQRKRLGILLEDGDKPVNGKWSFDADNRKKLPKGIEVPETFSFSSNAFVEEAKEYVQKNFADNYGEVENFAYPINHQEAQKVLTDFLENKLAQFGPYEDAMSTEHTVIFHSVLTPALNIGLIQPEDIVEQTLGFAERNDVPFASLEGFIRQIIGWREYMRAMYERHHVVHRTTNFWGNTRKIPQSFWKGTTGIEPIDHVIKNILKNGYAHHIERLMLLGNFMLLCEFDPDEVYLWFMEMFIDSYDWVMVPNVYAMSQFADGGTMTTKPYISGASYVKKMSDFKKGEWEDVWTALYWNFIDKRQDFFSKNYRLSMMVNLLNKMDETKRENHRKIAENFLNSL